MSDPKLSVAKSDDEKTTNIDKKTRKNVSKNKKKVTKKRDDAVFSQSLDKYEKEEQSAMIDDSVHLRRIQDQTQVVQTWHTHVENAKAAKKDAESKLKLEQERLHHVITGTEQTYLELKDSDETSIEERSIGVLNLPQDVEALLAAAALETIGKMRVYTGDGESFDDIEGIGEQLGNRIAESLSAYVSAH